MMQDKSSYTSHDFEYNEPEFYFRTIEVPAEDAERIANILCERLMNRLMKS